MGLDYSLVIRTDLEPLQALCFLAEELDLKWADDTHLLGPAIWLSASKESELGQTIIEEAFGFRPMISVGFRLDPNDDTYEAGKRTLTQGTIDLLRHDPGDAVLLFNSEHVLLQRIGGQLVIDAGWSEWLHVQLFDELALPFERRELTSPLL